MNRSKFSITFSEISWPEDPDGSGDDYIERSGYVAQNITLREAWEYLRGYHCEANVIPWRNASISWLTFYVVDDRPEYGLTRSLHLNKVTPSTSRRIARLFNAYKE